MLENALFPGNLKLLNIVYAVVFHRWNVLFYWIIIYKQTDSISVCLIPQV